MLAHFHAKGSFSEALIFSALVDVARKEDSTSSLVDNFQFSIGGSKEHNVFNFSAADDTWCVSEEATGSYSIQEAIAMLSDSSDGHIPRGAKAKAIRTFSSVQEAMEEVESTEKGKIVTANDIGCVLGSFILLHSLGIETATCAPLPLNDFLSSQDSDIVKEQLLVGLPVHTRPTQNASPKCGAYFGIAILKALTENSAVLSTNHTSLIRKIGRATTRSGGAVTVYVGETHTDKIQINLHESELWETDNLIQMEANLDDTTGENLGFVIELLLKNGAADA